MKENICVDVVSYLYQHHKSPGQSYLTKFVVSINISIVFRCFQPIIPSSVYSKLYCARDKLHDI